MDAREMLSFSPVLGAVNGRTGAAGSYSARPGNRSDRVRIALLEAEIAQTCYQLSRLRAEHRHLRTRIAPSGAPVADATPALADANVQ